MLNIEQIREALANITAEPLTKEDVIARRLQIHFGVTKEEALLLSAKIHMKNLPELKEDKDDKHK